MPSPTGWANNVEQMDAECESKTDKYKNRTQLFVQSDSVSFFSLAYSHDFYARLQHAAMRRASSAAPNSLPRILTFHLRYHVVDDTAVLVLRAEHDDLRVCIDFYIVPGWPVKQIVCVDRLLHTVRVSYGELAVHDETPMWALAQIPFQSLKQRGGIYTRRETEVLAADLAQSGCVAEISSLTDHGAWDFHLDVYVLFRHSHDRCSYVSVDAFFGGPSIAASN